MCLKYSDGESGTRQNWEVDSGGLLQAPEGHVTILKFDLKCTGSHWKVQRDLKISLVFLIDTLTSGCVKNRLQENKSEKRWAVQ